MSKDGWVQVQEALKSLYSIVKLKIDDYEVTLSLVRVSTYKLAIAIYVGGMFKGIWLTEDCEERRRFVRKTEKSLMSPKQKAEFDKFPKRMQKEFARKYNNMKYDFYSSVWTSFGALKKHLIENNKNIELVSIS